MTIRASYSSARSLCALAIFFLLGCAPGDESAQTSANASKDAPSTQLTSAQIADGLVENLATKYDPRTLYVVGNQYATGDGVEKDQDIAERLWRVSCERGHAYACSIYGSRQIEHQDYAEAARTLTMAAEAGVVDAIPNLIELHDSDAWPGASAEESVKWFEALQLLQNQNDPTQSNL
ncbi:MAG: tetratricopeptide repeat protein [Gammaproteobacteria bacterium]